MNAEISPAPVSGTARGVVLVVDDQIKNIQIVGTILTREGYEVIPATSGAQALQRINARVPDVVLLDVVMPEMDGFEVCRLLHERPDTASLPVIFVSAANDTDTIVRGLEAGGVDYMTKPFNKSELLARVRTHVDLQRARETTARYLREKEQLVSMVAHDLKNPLAAIRFSAQTLNGAPAEKVPQVAGLIAATCDQMLGFIDRFLSSRARETDHDGLTTSALATTEVEEMLEAWQATAKRKDITLTVAPAGSLIHASGDMFTVRQILDNLMSNAIKFSPLNSAVNVGISNDDTHLIVTIEDEGPGFADGDFDSLFQDYSRLSARPTAGESSTGLGLAIAKRGADRMGATLTIENRPSRAGTCARLCLPLLTE